MYSSLPCKRLLVGVSGSIHATHLIEYLVRFRREFAEQIRVIMTAAATQMIPPQPVELAADGPVLTDLWGTADIRSPHIRLTRWAELFVVVPATANTLGKAAGGIADDLLSTAILASEQPVVFAPSMNPTMWRNPAVQRNVSTLRADGHYVVEPLEGRSLTTGDLDTGLGPSPASLLTHLWIVHMCRPLVAY